MEFYHEPIVGTMNFMRLGHILILSFSSYPSPSRQGRLLGNLISALSPRFEADILTIRESELGYIEKFRKHRLLRVPVGGTYMQKVESFQRAISRQLDGDEYDIIHFRSPWEGHILAQNRQTLDAKFIYEPSLTLPLDSPEDLQKTFIKYDRLAMDMADLILVPSRHQEQLLKADPVLAAKVHRVPAGVDVNLFDFEHTTGLAPLDLIWVDNFNDWASTQIVFDGLARLKESRNQLSVGLVGPITAAFANDLVGLIARHGLAENVKFFGVQEEEDLPLLISRGRVALVGPRGPGPGAVPREDCLNLLEYMACRTPVVAPRLPYVTEVTSDGELARLYAPESAVELSRALLYVLNNPEKAVDMAEFAYETVREEYTAAQTRRRLVDIYAEMLAPLISEDAVVAGARPGRRRDSSISWQGQRTSSTGVGSPVPVNSPIDDGFHAGDMDTANLNFEDLRFEASGVLLGTSIEDEPTNPSHPAN